MSNMYSRAGLWQQGKGTDSCPEITEIHKNYTTNKN